MRRMLSSVTDAFGNLRRAPAMAFAIVVVSAVSLALLGVALMINSQVSLMKGYWYDRVEVSIFLAEDVTPSERSDLKTRLDSDPDIKKVFYESKEQAYSLFKEQFRNSPALVNSVTSDQLPESYRVKLADPEKFAQVQDRYANAPGVDLVQDQKKVLASFFNILHGIQASTLVLALVQILTALVLVVNTVRIAAVYRRKEIRIKRLVGAPRAMIALPFILEGSIAGFAGGLLSAFALVGLKVYLLDGRFSTSSTTFPLIGWPSTLEACFIVVLAGTFLAAAASALSILRQVKV